MSAYADVKMCLAHGNSLDGLHPSEGFRKKFGVETLFFCFEPGCPEFDWDKGPEKNLSEDVIAKNFIRYAFLTTSLDMPPEICAFAKAVVKELFRSSSAYEILCHKFRLFASDSR